MTLKEYIQELNQLAEKYPQALDCEVIVNYRPLGIYRKSNKQVEFGNWTYSEFTPIHLFEMYNIPLEKANFVCIN